MAFIWTLDCFSLASLGIAMTVGKYLTQPFEVFEDKKASITVTY